MEQYINNQLGEYSTSHLKQGIIVRKSNRELVGLVTSSSKGYTIRCTDGTMIGLEDTINNLIKRFANYSFYLL